MCALAQKRGKMKFNAHGIRKTLTPKIKENWLNESTCLPQFLPTFSKEQKQRNEKRISESLGHFRKQMDIFSHLPRRKKRWKNEMEDLLHEILWTEPLLGIEKAMSKESFDAFEAEMKALVRRVRRFDPALTLMAMGQALRNYIVYAIFLELNGLPQRCTANIFAYSMLYPYTDNYIDAPGRSREELSHYIKLIEDQILGKNVDAVTEHDRKTVELLSLVKASYEEPKDIDMKLLLLLEAQVDSQKQTDLENPLTDDELLMVTLLKGGLSVLLDRYFIGLPLTENDYEFYYSLGFLLQLCDDLQDISVDREEGCRTVFSTCQSKEETVQNVNRLFHFVKKRFDSYDCVRKEFKNFFMQNCLLLILTSAARSREYMTAEWQVWLEDRLPVSAEYLQERKRNDSSEALKKSHEELMKMVDAYIV